MLPISDCYGASGSVIANDRSQYRNPPVFPGNFAWRLEAKWSRIVGHQEHQFSMDKNLRPSNRVSDQLNEMVTQSVGMLVAVINGETYEAVAAKFGKSRTAVERRIKAIATQVTKAVGIQGLNEEGATFVRRLRLHRDAILIALASFEPAALCRPRENRIVSREEIARLAVRDYLDVDGGVRQESEMRAEVAITGKTRPLHFSSTRLDDMTLPLNCVVLSPTITRPFCAVPRTSVVRIASD